MQGAGGAQCEVYLDGGVRSGTDVAKAIALGARAVCIGRPVLWGLAHNVSNAVPVHKSSQEKDNVQRYHMYYISFS